MSNDPSRETSKHALPGLPEIPEQLKHILRVSNEIKSKMAAVPTFDKRFIGLSEMVVNPFWRDFSSQLAPLVGHVNTCFAHVGQMVNAALDGCRARLESYPNLLQRCELLAESGWFLSLYFGLSEIDEIASVDDPSSELLEQLMVQAYRLSIEEHANSILRDFPEREFVIRPAVAAHLRGEFGISVPIFFAQADGICSAAARRYIFSGVPGGDGHISSLARAEISKLDSEENDDEIGFFRILDRSLWNSIAETRPIAYNDKRRKESGYAGLNRHRVLHGESLDYATEVNSLKAFSLLSYTSSLLVSQKCLEMNCPSAEE